MDPVVIENEVFEEFSKEVKAEVEAVIEEMVNPSSSLEDYFVGFEYILANNLRT